MNITSDKNINLAEIQHNLRQKSEKHRLSKCKRKFTILTG